MLPFSLAVRFLKAGKGQTVLIITGIGIAVAAQIFVGLLITSLQQTLLDRTVGNQPQVTITSTADDALIPNGEAIAETISATGLVKTASLSASGSAFLRDGSRITPVLVRGFDENADTIYDITGTVYEGSWSQQEDEVLVGKVLREENGYQLDETITITTPQGKRESYRISGFFDFGVQQLNSSWVVTDLGTAQKLFDYDAGVTSVEMRVDDYFRADKIAESIAGNLNDNGIKVSNWKESNEQLLSGLQGQSISSLMIQIFIIVSVVIAISAILAITVFQKSRQLGILKAMGIKDRSASLIFIFEGLIIGLIGSVIGVALGLVLIYGFSVGTSQPGSQPLIDLYFDIPFIIISWGIAVAASVIAALIPARRSLRLSPIDVIREG